ncbi:long-chain-fatty-acid--CoA ligase (plasmid) [Sphingomonas paeninsulae]|jgi:acyl-CoA synthetase (AMP-forming)/AMP-acid ligase II|uniref:3-methylmercaptopropionyl-CoA ligase n=1 Tax=Sphingomonas paeninsulae TaxID=2319844 RepID=A0A494TDQ9_SPHPE|nr:long-chain fatty acid--CoA ligase [Sphingomonas paeninsulae]AYJ85404.1 long-chain-fatty-acid--CoA ligase [Sphingomonas paeninsulae]
MYLTQCLHRMDRQAPDRIAGVDAARTLTWRELSARVAAFAGALRERGLVPGDRVAMLARNGTDFLTYVLGTFWAGGVINPVNLRWTAGEIGYSLENCQTRFLIVDPEFAALVPGIRAAAPGLSHLVETGAPLQAWIDTATPVEDALRRGDDLAAILYTGGTTGFPKGVMLSHTNLASSMLGSIACQRGLAGDRYLHTAPLFHIGALSGLFVALFSGSTSHFLPAFEPLAAIEAVARDRISELFLVPTMIRMVVDHPRFAEFDMGSVQRVRYGASSIDGALLDRAIAAFPNAGFIQAYGMTELSPTVTILGPEDHGAEARANGRLRSAGRATPTTEIRIVGPDDEELPRGEVGEIVARGPTVMLGYWQMPDATAEALRGGWMHTGDLGRMDDEGYITVVDRLKDMIITGGENVYSAEVENALATHPDVAGLAVVAVPDPKWGERVHAVIVPRGGATPTPDALIAHCRITLAGYKIPRSFAFVDALPLSAAGKVLKNVLRDAARDDTTVNS